LNGLAVEREALFNEDEDLQDNPESGLIDDNEEGVTEEE